MICETLRTDRLSFRRLSHADLPRLLEFFNDPAATQFLPVQPPVESHATTWISRQLNRYALETGGLCALELLTTGEFIGQCGLIYQWVDGIPKWEVGYHLLPRFWGQGYATEAAIACRNFCFENEMAETLISIIHPDNLRSQAVASRNGMSFWKNSIFKETPVKVFRIRRVEWEINL